MTLYVNPISVTNLCVNPMSIITLYVLQTASGAMRLTPVARSPPASTPTP